MATFTYKAFDKKANKEVSASLEAGSQLEAVAAIKKQGLLPIEVKEAKGKAAKAAASFKSGAGSKQINIPGFGGGVKPAQVTLFTRQLSTLQDAGLPIVQSLQILTDMQRPGKFKETISRVTEEVQGGSMLSEAMARHPKIWDKLYTNLVKAGETAGALDTILRRLAEFREKAEKLKKKVIGALIYPVAVLSIAVIILSFIMIVIVPKFELIFRELGITLPGLTEFLITFSRFMADWWWTAVLGIIFITMALKVSFLRMFSARLRQTMILDEPFKNLDKERIVRATEWLHLVSVEFGMQFIIITHIEELVSNSDRVFRFSLEDGVTKVETKQG